MTRDAIWLDIVTERFRQERLCREGKFPATLAHQGALAPAACLAVLAEEFGEVARPVADHLAAGARGGAPLDVAHLREELIQLAACAVAWVEQLDEVPQQRGPRLLSERPRAAVPGYLEEDMMSDGLGLDAATIAGVAA
jgi:hypothetical protein